MNKLKNVNISKGFPLEPVDLVFFQDAIREMFEGVADGFGLNADDTYIVSGISYLLTGSNHAFSAGFIVIAGELYKFDGGSIPDTTDLADIYLIVDETFDSGGDKVFEDDLSTGTITQTHAVRKAVLGSTTPAPSGSHLFNNLSSLADRFARRLAARTINVWAAMSSYYESGFSDFGGSNFGLAAKLNDIDNYVELHGHAKEDTPGSKMVDTLLFTIPATLPGSSINVRPSKEQTLCMSPMGSNLSNGRPCVCKVKTNGEVWLLASAGNPFDTTDISFDGLRYDL